ncbi:rubisco LSMT substrate-binding domain-containing protein [Phthorimaea operculella]|nr:rubisco LSMT substrate-binding domain-containing protein [Phthorimaea operculella]
MTRQNNIQLADTDVTAFIPLWDMCNHEQGKITTDFNKELSRGECYALRDFKSGEQIFIFYGARSNADLFLHNGSDITEQADFNKELSRGECYALRDFKSGEQIFIFYGARSNADLFLHNGYVYYFTSDITEQSHFKLGEPIFIFYDARSNADLFLHNGDITEQSDFNKELSRGECYALRDFKSGEQIFIFYGARSNADLFLHNGDITEQSDFNKELSRGECYALRDFKSGEQIFIFYGARSNADLFLHNGYVCVTSLVISQNKRVCYFTSDITEQSDFKSGEQIFIFYGARSNADLFLHNGYVYYFTSDITEQTDFNKELSRGECYALRDFKSGEQIFIFYGARSNADLFLHNGYVYYFTSDITEQTDFNKELSRGECYALRDFKSGEQIFIFYAARSNADLFLHNGYVCVTPLVISQNRQTSTRSLVAASATLCGTSSLANRSSYSTALAPMPICSYTMGFHGLTPQMALRPESRFVYPNNPYDSLSIALGVSANDPLREDKLALLSKLGLAGVTHYNLYKGEKPISAELLAFIRIFTMNPDDLTKWKSIGMPSNLVSEEAETIVGTSNERRAYNYVLTRCKLIKSAYKEGDAPDSQSRQKIRTLHVCENQVLDGAIKYLETTLQKLPPAKEEPKK